MRASLPATVEIHQKFEVPSDTILADPTQIQQVLMNLCTNAAHAMSDEGRVLEVSLGSVDLDSAAVLRYPELSPGLHLELCVRDTRRGMDQAVMERIFEPFFTTKKKGEGTGLGLSVVHGIVKGHRGAIAVYSEPGTGTTVRVFLPLIETRHDSQAPTTESVPKGDERILFVDDDLDLVQIAQEMLQPYGYEVVGRTSSIEALEAFSAQPDKFDLVITDKTMPHLTGFSLAREMKRIRPDIPIILCTGFSEMPDTEEAGALGISEMIMKPLLTQQMAEAVRRVMDQEQQHKILAQGQEEGFSPDAHGLRQNHTALQETSGK